MKEAPEGWNPLVAPSVFQINVKPYIYQPTSFIMAESNQSGTVVNMNQGMNITEIEMHMK